MDASRIVCHDAVMPKEDPKPDRLTPLEEKVAEGHQWRGEAVLGLQLSSDGYVFGLQLYTRAPGKRWQRARLTVWDSENEGATVLMERLHERLGQDTPR